MSEVRHMAVAPTGVQHLAGGDTIDRHRHDDHQLVYVSTGVLAVQTAAGSWVASPDLAVWLPAGTWHEHRFYGTSVFHTVSFPADRPPLPDHAPTIVAVSGLLHELLVACTDPALTPAQERRVRARHPRPAAIHTPGADIAAHPRDARLSAACEIAASRVAQPVSLASLAQQIGASQRTLSRLFRAELGMTYPQWRTRLRVLHAMILLAGGHSVTDTAHQCGWATTSSFIDTFRRAMGQTPGAYKPTTI